MIDLDELKRLVGLPGDIGYNKMAFWMADHAQEIIAEIERLQARLEVDPRHNYDGIDCRDVTIRLQDERIDALEVENAQLRKYGGTLANVAFNLAQKLGHTLTHSDCADLDKLRKQWDSARPTSSAPETSPQSP
jgi:hypothetical protein